MLGLLLGIAFIGVIVFLFLWRYIILKVGMKLGFIISMITFIITLIPFMFISDPMIALIAFFFVGLGMSGSFLFIDVIIPAIVDYDELQTGIRREGSYFGVNALIIRLSTIFIFLTISLVFDSVGWRVFDPLGATEATKIGLRHLIFTFPAIALGLGILTMSLFPITKKKYQQIKNDIKKLHAEKKEKVKRS